MQDASPSNWLDRVALGLVPGCAYFYKFGRNPDVDTGVEDIWSAGGIRTLPSAAAVVSVVSTSTEDDGDPGTGTGIHTLTLEGLDANYDEISETITMDGTTPATTSASFLRLNRMYGVTAGSSEDSVGIITASIGGDTQAIIQAGHGQTKNSQYTVPNNKWLLVERLSVEAGRTGTNDVVSRFKIKLDGESVWREQAAIDIYEGQVTLEGALVLPPKTEIRVSATVTGSNLNISAFYTGVLIQAGFLNSMGSTLL